MRDSNRHFASIACALCVLVLATAASHAQNVGDADKREISAYTLTEAGLGKYKQATRNLKGLKTDDCGDDSDDDSEVKSLANSSRKSMPRPAQRRPSSPQA